MEGERRLSDGATGVAGARRGFTLIELMVVVAIIGMLVGMLMSGIHMVRIIAFRNETKLTLKHLRIGIINMKRNYSYDTMLGAYTSGRTVATENKFQDPRHNFPADLDGGNLYILAGQDASGTPRKISGPAGHELTVDGAPFAAGEGDLEYYVEKADGTLWPTLDIVKELEPNNAAWSAAFVPQLNSRKTGYFNCKPGRIMTVGTDTLYVDPWRQPYLYRLEWLDLNGDTVYETLVEKVVCAGQDTILGTKDDGEEEVFRTRVGG